MILTAGERRIDYPINNPQDALEFAQAYASDPAALFDLVNARIEGDGAHWVREALKSHLWAFGNSSKDALIGLVNLIRNREWVVHAPHIHDVGITDVPAICVASGPSLADHLDELRTLQSSCLIICADSAINGLHAAGIYPHIATPVERDESLRTTVTKADYGITYAGSLYTDRSINKLFSNHIVVPSDECLGHWVDERRLGYGSSTGTMSVALALTLTVGPVYLVGHDIAHGKVSHWDGASCPPERVDDTCEGNDGETHTTNHWFKMFRDQIATLAIHNRRIYNVNILNRVGAMIPGTLPGNLPDPHRRAIYRWQPTQADPSIFRQQLPLRIATLPPDLVRARDLIAAASTLEQLSAEVICGGENMTIAIAMFRPIWTQFSFERRMGLPPDKVFKGTQAAMLNVLDGSLKHIVRECHG